MAFFQIEVVQGETWTTTVPYCDAAGDPIAVDDAVFVVRRFPRDSAPVFSLGVGSGITIGGAGSNEITPIVTGAQNELEPGRYTFELRISGPSGSEPFTSLLSGPYVVLPGAA